MSSPCSLPSSCFLTPVYLPFTLHTQHSEFRVQTAWLMGKTLKLAVNSGHFFPFSWPGPGTFPVCLERSEQCCPGMLASAPRIRSFPICQWPGRRGASSGFPHVSVAREEGASSGSLCACPLRLVVWATLKQQTGHEQVRTCHVLHLLSCLHKLTQTCLSVET